MRNVHESHFYRHVLADSVMAPRFKVQVPPIVVIITDSTGDLQALSDLIRRLIGSVDFVLAPTFLESLSLQLYSSTIFWILCLKLQVLGLMCFCISDGRQESVSFDKITSRIQKLCYGLNVDFVDPVSSKHYKHLASSKFSYILLCNPFPSVSTGSDYNEGDPGSVQRCDHCGAGHPGSRDGGHPHHQIP